MGQPSEVICLNVMIGEMGSGIIQRQSGLFWIQIGNLGEFLLPPVHLTPIRTSINLDRISRRFDSFLHSVDVSFDLPRSLY
jgi:hypothetical protein